MSWHTIASLIPMTETAPTAVEPSPSPEREVVEQLENRVRGLERELEERAQASYRRGLQEGDAAARQQLAAQLSSTLTRLARSIEEIAGLRQRFRHEAEADVVKLSLAIARRVLHRELTVDADALVGIVKAALAKIDSRELHRVRMHPESSATLQQQLDQMGLPTRVEVVGDRSLETGAVIFETARGSLDASVQTQLSEIERGFADLIHDSP